MGYAEKVYQTAIQSINRFIKPTRSLIDQSINQSTNQTINTQNDLYFISRIIDLPLHFPHRVYGQRYLESHIYL